MSYVKRAINLSFALGKGNFGDSGFDTVSVTGLRVSCQIVKSGLPTNDTAEIRVWGLPPKVINQLVTLGTPLTNNRNNLITVTAGDAKSGMSQVFKGTIQRSYLDAINMPETGLAISSNACAFNAAAPVPPISIQGPVDVATVCAQIAASMNMTLENNGVTGVLGGAIYLPGTALAQLKAFAAMVPINAYVDTSRAPADTGSPSDAAPAPQGASSGNPGVLAIWPINGSRSGQVLVISKDTGLVGYPQFADSGVALRTLFNPGLAVGQAFELKLVTEAVKAANGTYQAYSLVYNLESEVIQNGAWFIDLVGIRPTGNGQTL